MCPDTKQEETLDLIVDGEAVSLKYEEGESLMKALRREGYYAVKNGCSEGVCGACNVMYGDNQIVRSCLVPAERYEGEELTTAEGLIKEDGSLHPLQEEFLEFGAAQCGFCIPGMILSGVQLLEKNPDPSEDEIQRALKGNICRCTGYIQQFEAIQSAAKKMSAEGDKPSQAGD